MALPPSVIRSPTLVLTLDYTPVNIYSHLSSFHDNLIKTGIILSTTLSQSQLENVTNKFTRQTDSWRRRTQRTLFICRRGLTEHEYKISGFNNSSSSAYPPESMALVLSPRFIALTCTKVCTESLRIFASINRVYRLERNQPGTARICR